jgi:hypothetical protein
MSIEIGMVLFWLFCIDRSAPEYSTVSTALKEVIDVCLAEGVLDEHGPVYDADELPRKY